MIAQHRSPNRPNHRPTSFLRGPDLSLPRIAVLLPSLAPPMVQTPGDVESKMHGESQGGPTPSQMAPKFEQIRRL